jgi:hypothetical protein
MMVGREKRYHRIFILSYDGLETDSNGDCGSAVGGLDYFAPVAHVRQLLEIVRLMRTSKREEGLLLSKKGRDSLARVRKEAFASKEIAELFGPLIARH